MTEKDAPDLSRRRLCRVLALTDDAAPDEIRSASTLLLRSLRGRLKIGEEADAEGLGREIAAIESSAAHWSRSVDSAAVTAPVGRLDRQSLAGAMLGALVMIGLLVAYAAGFRITQIDQMGLAAALEEPAELLLVGRLPGATLRVLDADREEILLKIPAEGARIELREGRYALEVSREDCPDRWTRSVYFEAGATHRFEPLICLGEGQLTVRSNVSKDRLQIDGLDVGGTGPQVHTIGVGDHAIRVEKIGFVPFEGRIRIGPDEALELRAELRPATTPGGSAGGAGGLAAAAAAVGRPMPVTKTGPARPPLGGIGGPEPFDMAGLRAELRPSDIELPRGRFLARDRLVESPDAGSTAWHDQVSSELLRRFDSDASGRIDRLEESEAISCAVWLEIESEFDRGGLGLSMARYFGFDGTEWHPGALGFARALRSAAYAKMQECGLQD